MLIFQKNSYFSTILAVVLFVLISGCAKYSPKPLRIPSGVVKQNGDIEVSKKIFSEADSKRFFDRKLIARGYQPIQLYIKNNSDKIYVLNSRDIALPLEPVDSVATSMHRDVAWKATKYFILLGPVWAALEGYNSYEINKKIDSDLKVRTVNEQDTIEIKPGGVFNRIMFVSNENLQTSFDLKLESLDKEKKINFSL